MIFKIRPDKSSAKISLAVAVTLPILVFCLIQTGFTQEPLEANDPIPLDVSGSVSVTNDGISTIPSLSLGKPAALFNLSVGRRFHFDPEFRYSLEGEPWSFIFRFRYDLVDTENFFFRVGLNPFLSFKTLPAVIDEVPREAIEARRGGGLELFSNYGFREHFSVGTYSIHGHGFDEGLPNFTNYISLYGSLSELSLFHDLFLNLRPQFFYLNIDGTDGFYIASSIELGLVEIPFTVSCIINRTLTTEITGNPDLLWNVSLNYGFSF